MANLLTWSALIITGCATVLHAHILRTPFRTMQCTRLLNLEAHKDARSTPANISRAVLPYSSSACLLFV